jgi:hypothetical protein
MGQDGVSSEHQYLMMPLFRPTDCAAVGGPTISRVHGWINDEKKDEMKECSVCGDAVVHDMTEHSFFGFACSCPYGPPKEEDREP